MIATAIVVPVLFETLNDPVPANEVRQKSTPWMFVCEQPTNECTNECTNRLHKTQELDLLGSLFVEQAVHDTSVPVSSTYFVLPYITFSILL